jgi:hypothetical protein
MTQRPKFSIDYYLTIFLLMLLLESMFFPDPRLRSYRTVNSGILFKKIRLKVSS